MTVDAASVPSADPARPGLQEPVVELRAGGTSVVLDLRPNTGPRIVHWGPDLGPHDPQTLLAIADSTVPQLVTGHAALPTLLTVLPLESDGGATSPAFQARRGRAAVMPTLAGFQAHRSPLHWDIGEFDTITVTVDDSALTIEMYLAVTPEGVLLQRGRVVNTGADLELTRFELTFPIPDSARELLDTAGHHFRERHPQRHALTIGSHERRSWRGRTGLEATILQIAGSPGFGFESGRAHGVHFGWSGNSTQRAERTANGLSLLTAGEEMHPGEVVLSEGDEYTTPTAYGSWGDGLTMLSSRFHSLLRSRAGHPRRPRPVTVNTWEAVYFEHDLDRLRALADRAADVGAERFVLDDGWFRGRRNDRAGLGDWTADPEIWPHGLDPIIDHVTSLGMEFGLWIEPEMVNPDSDLARFHPDWILGPAGRATPQARHQLVLDLANPETAKYLLDSIDALLSTYAISYLKWDHNRDLLEPVGPDGRARVHDGVLALYQMLDELRRRHPDLEIESCASGGGRIDLGILARTDRVWASDCIDPLERQTIQPYTGLLLPPELIGQHIGSSPSHTTGRHHDLEFRAGTALLGHLGIEWDLTALSSGELAALRHWVDRHKELRPLIAAGRVVRSDHPDPSATLFGIIGPNATEAAYIYAQLRTSDALPPGRIRLPGLPREGLYEIRLDTATPLPAIIVTSPLRWAEGTTVDGATLAEAGLQTPVMNPGTLIVIRATRVREVGADR